MPAPARPRRPLYRLPILALGMACLFSGVWGGLARIGWPLPGGPTTAELVALHGPLMSIGFLGGVISLERAVALGRWWGYAAPIAIVGGMLGILAGLPAAAGQLLQLVGASVLVALMALVLGMQRNAANWTLLVAALLLVAGISMWMAGLAPVRVAPWWAGFLMLTILGERLELAAMGRLTPVGTRLFAALVALLLGGLLLLAGGSDEVGTRMTGAATLGCALWLWRFDIARRTVRRRGLPRFVALALLPGYAWLGAGGALWLMHGAALAGPVRDAQLHAVFVGFVFSMIFGHAPVIFPAVLGIRIPFRRAFYVHLALLHAGLVVRVLGDIALGHEVARIGALVNAAAIGLFLLATVASALVAAASRRRAA